MSSPRLGNYALRSPGRERDVRSIATPEQVVGAPRGQTSRRVVSGSFSYGAPPAEQCACGEAFSANTRWLALPVQGPAPLARAAT